MNTTDTYIYKSIFYTWHHEPQNEYCERHISIDDCIRVINTDNRPLEQKEYDPPRWKFVGQGSHIPISVITEDDWTTIVTAWKSSRAERGG